MKDRMRHSRRRMRGLLRKRQALVVGLVLLAAVIPGATHAVRSHASPLSLQRAAGPGRAAQGEAPPASRPIAGVARKGELPSGRTLSKPVEHHLARNVSPGSCCSTRNSTPTTENSRVPARVRRSVMN